MEWAYRLNPALTMCTGPGGPVLVTLSPLSARPLPPQVVRLLEACDGRRTAHGLASALPGTPPAELSAVLEDLANRNLLVREVPPAPAGPEEAHRTPAGSGGSAHTRAAAAARAPARTPSQRQWPSVSVIIPVRNRAGQLADCLRSLDGLRYPKDRLEVIVVDDASTDGTPDVARAQGAHLIPMGGHAGISASRNAGAKMALGEILAFTDSDCEASPDWLLDLIPAFDDPKVAVVGGFVAGPGGKGALDLYEEAFSPLCMGKRVAELGPGRPVAYVATANALVRRSAFLEAGGFAEELQVGEDVDLCWRLLSTGHRGWYIPAGRIIHHHRTLLKPFLIRRAQYATSEAWLEAHHPAALKRIGLAAWHLVLLAVLAAALLLAPAWAPLAAAAVLLAHFLDRFTALARLGVVAPGLALRSVASIHLAAGGTISAIVSRYYLLPLLLLGFWVPACLWVAGVCLVINSGLDWWSRRPPLDPVRFLVIRLLEMLAYQAGVYAGCISHRNPSPVLPALRISTTLSK